jgi:hypothetical protein
LKLEFKKAAFDELEGFSDAAQQVREMESQTVNPLCGILGGF